ncbi:MAG: DUF1488 domain-containing protein [Proteobacteria bacterium]|nr:DUF1488 domain-containing protein [Pseudomonadota bacterium]
MSEPSGFVAAPPRWDRNRVLFEIEDDGRRVACAISLQAIQDASGRRFHDGVRLLDCFGKVRTRIERIALGKLHARPHEDDQVLTIWSGDLDD